MKKSKFNYFVKEGDRVICCNTLSGKIFSVNPNEYAIIQEVLNNPILTEKKVLKDWLVEHQFMAEDNVDEVDTLRLRNRESVFENTYQLVINPTQECNFSCWYCYQNHPRGYMTENTVESIKKFISKLVTDQKIKGFNLGWFGGEPLLYYNEVVHPLSLYIKGLMDKHSLTFYNSMTTNGYLINEQIVKANCEIGLFNFQITLDGDRESHNRTRNSNGKPSFDAIIANIITMCDYDSRFRIMLRINYTDDIIQKDYVKTLEIIPAKIRHQIRINFQRVWQTHKRNETKSEDNLYLINSIHQLRNMGFMIAISSYRIKQNRVCYADRFYYAHINWDGKVYKCTARDYRKENQVGELLDSGQIKWKSGELERRYLKAPFENNLCLKCNNLSLCGGPCSQKKIDHENNPVNKLCVNHVHEIKIDTFIRQEYYNTKAHYTIA
jgi:uncharacterized protein